MTQITRCYKILKNSTLIPTRKGAEKKMMDRKNNKAALAAKPSDRS